MINLDVFKPNNKIYFCLYFHIYSVVLLMLGLDKFVKITLYHRHMKLTSHLSFFASQFVEYEKIVYNQI